jgi:hypothetical protein
MLRRLKMSTAAPAFFLLAALTNPLPGEAAPPCDPTGQWMLRCVPPDGKARSCVVTIRREGGSIKGTYTADGETRDAEEVVFARGVLSVRVGGKYAGQSYGLTYVGRPAGDALRGTVRWSYGFVSGSFAFEGERIGQIVADAH